MMSAISTTWQRGTGTNSWPREPAKADWGITTKASRRIYAIGFLQTPAGRKLLGQRVAIDRCFGNWTSFGGGLAPLPAWLPFPTSR